MNGTKRLRDTPITAKQKIFLILRFIGFAFFWYLVAQIVLGALAGFIFFSGSDHHQFSSQEELMTHFFEEFFNSGAPIVIIILSLIVSLGVSTLQTLKKIKQYKQENSKLAEQ